MAKHWKTSAWILVGAVAAQWFYARVSGLEIDWKLALSVAVGVALVPVAFAVAVWVVSAPFSVLGWIADNNDNPKAQRALVSVVCVVVIGLALYAALFLSGSERAGTLGAVFILCLPGMVGQVLGATRRAYRSLAGSDSSSAKRAA